MAVHIFLKKKQNVIKILYIVINILNYKEDQTCKPHKEKNPNCGKIMQFLPLINIKKNKKIRKIRKPMIG